MIETPETDIAWDDSDPLWRLSDPEKRKFAQKLERERNKCQDQLDALFDRFGVMRELMIDAELKSNDWKTEAEKWRDIAYGNRH